MPGFCTSVTLVFILGVKFFDYAVDGGNLRGSESGEPNIDIASRWGGSNLQEAMVQSAVSFQCFCFV